jgi:hypothetical protein
MSVTAVTPSANCSVSLANGIITYTPVQDLAGPDSFAYTLSDSRGASAQGAVSVHVSVPNGQGPSVLGISPIVNNTVTVSFAGIPGLTYTIEASSDFHNWSVLGTATAGTDGVMQFQDTHAGEFQTRYYRARYP